VSISSTARPSVHPPLTKSFAIDQIEDIERLRAVAHRMWEAFLAAHEQSAHAIAILAGFRECAACLAYIKGDSEQPCERWRAWQDKVSDGFGSL
jgi:hypothetical protein